MPVFFKIISAAAAVLSAVYTAGFAAYEMKNKRIVGGTAVLGLVALMIAVCIKCVVL